MANVTITRDTKANIEAIPIADGRIYFETDQTYNHIYADVGTNRIQIGGTIAINDLLAEISNLGDWTAPTLQNSWVNFDNGYAPVGYWKDINGTVHLRGLIKGGNTNSGTILFTLPSGYRPAYNESFSVYQYDTGISTGAIDISPTGQVILRVPTNSTYISLSGITFRAEN